MPREGEWIARDFKFHTGEVMKEVKLHYTMVGNPAGEPVVALHGSGLSANSMLSPTFGGELFGPGQPLDAAKYYIIIPDGIRHVRLIIGNSMGGMNAWVWGERYPGYMDALRSGVRPRAAA